MQSNPRIVSSLQTFSLGASVCTILVGSLVLFGWIFDIVTLKSVIPIWVTMKPNTALAFLLAGVSLWLLRAEQASPRTQHIAQACAFAVALVGLLTLGQYLFGWELGIDQLLFNEPSTAVGTSHPGRMAPLTALSFSMLGFALLVVAIRRRYWVAQTSAITVAIFALLAFIGYLYDTQSLYGIFGYTEMAAHTALTFIVLCVGILSARPGRGLMVIFTSDSSGGILARSLTVPMIGVPVALGWLRLQGQRAGLYGTEFGVALFVVCAIIISVTLVGWNAIVLMRSDDKRKRAEELGRQAKEAADRANLAKSEFLSRMSHELRTPLNAILGFGQLLEMDSLNPEQREGVEHILQAGRHLLDLINEVLDIARIEAGRLSISTEPVSVSEVVRESLDLIAPLAAEVNVRLESQTAGTPDRFVLADRQRLKQVLLNFLSNAVKYNRRAGVVTLSYEETAEGRLRIEVNDTGPGIAPERMARLFTPFERLGAEQTVIEGTGLGLALSKGLVEAMGGTLGAESTVGRGSTFWMEFSLVEGPVERLRRTGVGIPGKAELDASKRAQIVLYIDDNLSNVTLIRRLMAHRPEVRLIPATQGRVGLDLAREHRPHLILLDLHLADIAGDEILRRLREDPETSQIPVVVISADATVGQVDRLLAAGARKYLAKPLDVRKFLAILDEALKEREPGHAGRNA